MVELHDNFSVSELEHIVDLGLCGEDEVGRLVEEGSFDISGRIPINMSGGLLGKGHPTSANGNAQFWKITRLLKLKTNSRRKSAR